MTNATRSKECTQHPGKKAQRREAERRQRRQRDLLLGLVGLVAVVVVVAVVLTAGGGGTDTPASAVGEVSIDRAPGPLLGVGDTVPGFSAPELGGGRFDWSSAAGTPTVLAVWAPWCQHCQAELPRLAAAVGRHPELQLVSAATAIGQEPGPSVATYMSDNNLTFPVAIDDTNDAILRGLGVTSFPTVFYVGSDGKVVGVSMGEVPASDLEARLGALASA